MLSDFAYLWKYREQPTQLRRWFVVMAKRLILLFALLHLLIRPVVFRIKGARIGRLVVFGRARIKGKLGNLTIGDQTSLGQCEIALHDTVSIGRRVVINDGVVFLTASHSLSDPQWRHKKRPITVGDYAWIATNAIVLPGVSIGKGAVVGAGAVVRKDIPEYAVVTGNPSSVQSVQRTKKLTYSPVLLNAPFEAWIGRNLTKININGELL